MEGSSSNVATRLEVVPPSTPSRRKRQRVQDNVKAYAVQCDKCRKWRLINSKEKYEQIRATIVEEPFICETAREWRPSITCDDDPDLVRDGSWRWAIDKPCIPLTPSGWQRVVRIRAQGGTRFADLYYVTPSSSDYLRSSVQVQSYLDEHPELGLNLSQFSFQIPSPLEENYVNAASCENAEAVMPVPASTDTPVQTNAFQGSSSSTLALDVDAGTFEYGYCFRSEKRKK